MLKISCKKKEKKRIQMKKKNYFRIIQVNLQVKIFSFEKKSMEQKIFADLYLIIHEEKRGLPFN